MNRPSLSPPSLRHPAEWEPHSACWLAFPRLPEEWPGYFEAACGEFAQLCRGIADCDPVTGQPRGERLNILVFDQSVRQRAEQYLAGLPVYYHLCPYDDIWLRDTAPIFVQKAGKAPQRSDRPSSLSQPPSSLPSEVQDLAVRFCFNGWGSKYDFPHDVHLAQALVQMTHLPSQTVQLVAEGGALESDGQGTCLTTRQCLLNPNRNPGITEAEINSRLQAGLGYQKIIWLDQGLINDHTDGHIDTLARFVCPGVVMVMEARTAQDPNAAVLKQIARQLSQAQDAQGRMLQLVTLPSPGPIRDGTGDILPASYLNFYIANTCVLVPTYESPFDAPAIAAIQACFPTRRVIGLSARALITGGGAFHCITQQQP